MSSTENLGNLLNHFTELIDLKERMLALNGNKESQYICGLHAEQNGDFDQAMFWYKLASKQGCLFSWHNMGMLLFHNYKSPKEAQRCFENAVNAGHDSACLTLASIYLDIAEQLEETQEIDGTIINDIIKKAKRLVLTGIERECDAARKFAKEKGWA